MQKPARSKGAKHTYFMRVSAKSLSYKIYADLLSIDDIVRLIRRNIFIQKTAHLFDFVRTVIRRREKLEHSHLLKIAQIFRPLKFFKLLLQLFVRSAAFVRRLRQLHFQKLCRRPARGEVDFVLLRIENERMRCRRVVSTQASLVLPEMNQDCRVVNQRTVSLIKRKGVQAKM